MSALRELNRRESAGLVVLLLWNQDTGEVVVTIESGNIIERYFVEPANALDAFNHPYVYAAAPLPQDVEVPAADLQRTEWMGGES